LHPQTHLLGGGIVREAQELQRAPAVLQIVNLLPLREEMAVNFIVLEVNSLRILLLLPYFLSSTNLIT